MLAPYEFATTYKILGGAIHVDSLLQLHKNSIENSLLAPILRIRSISVPGHHEE